MLHRVYFDGQLPIGAELSIEGEELHHAVRVARVRSGEQVELFDGRGTAVRARIVDAGRESLRVQIEEAVPPRESPLDLTLAMSVIQLEKFELVLQKATELGARAFIPLVADRNEIRPERYRGKSERWEKIVLEAVKQSGRSVLPRIEPPAALEAVAGREGEKLFLDADHPAATLPPSPSKVIVLVGPEGGWSDREIALATAARFHFINLGPRRLRAETAAIVASGIITAHYGDI